LLKDIKKASNRNVASWGSRPPKLPKSVHVKRKKSHDIFWVWWKKAKRPLVTASPG